ncbi:hypothetical protein B0T21DRAFT_356549 [Apiosordaria backusii]|uniref:Uncharacterized protein n=1 Tax=Apiosordaria backusii TaxID=314023 RepID=A0AA40EZJ3_9PEZI|nr:hypothetical protein B0T21DRAFT_356549 [Apiosordaria backusii]
MASNLDSMKTRGILGSGLTLVFAVGEFCCMEEDIFGLGRGWSVLLLICCFCYVLGIFLLA